MKMISTALRCLAGIMAAVMLLQMPGLSLADTKLMVVSDLHYMAPALYKNSDLFLQVLRRGDGKIT